MKFQGKNSNAFNYIDSKYKFRFNVVTNFYEFKLKNSKSKWRKYDDRDKNNILLELIEEYMDVPENKINLFIESEKFSKDYNPFEEYFYSLKKPKEKGNYIAKIAKTITTKDSKRFEDTLRRFLVGTIDCLLKPDNVNDVALVFQSGQGLGKTRWMRKLLPKKFRQEYLYEGNIDTKNKDHVMYLSQYWFIHLDELESLRSNDISQIKSYITRQRISVRKAYGRYKTNFVRRASFLGSVNDDKFLTDTTGNRRWLVFEVSKINYQHKIDADKVWQEAYWLWKSGYRHWFNIDEIKVINQSNEKFRAISLEEELLLRYFVFSKDSGDMLSSSEVIEKIAINTPQMVTKLNSIKMGKALSKHTKEKKMQSGIQKYFLEYIGKEEDEYNNESNYQGNQKIDENDDLPF